MIRKIFLQICLLLVFIVGFSSCGGNDYEDEIFLFGLTSATSFNSQEIETIELAYYDAFKRAGLNFNSQNFASGTSKNVILKACEEAEKAIESSSVKFNGSYVYEVRTKDEVIYRRVYGTR